MIVIALIIAASLQVGRPLKEYWNIDSEGAYSAMEFGAFMSRDRFCVLWAHISFNDSNYENKRGEEGYDRLYKLRPLINLLTRTFMRYWSPGTYMSVDEAMVASKHRSYMRQYMKAKLIKWGFKLWCLACPHTGYIYKFVPYVGLAPGEPRQTGLSYTVVMTLAQGLAAGSCIVADRYFCSPLLALGLLAVGMHLCGTVQTNRKGMPEDIYENLPKKPTRGDHFWNYCSNTKIRVATWYDNCWVNIISTFGGVTGATATRVITKQRVRSKGDIPCPAIILIYNSYMGGVDLGDQLRSASQIEKTFGTKKWHHKLFLGILALASTNAFILYQYYNPHKTHRQFRKKLQAQLLSTATRLVHDPKPSYDNVPTVPDAETSCRMWYDGSEQSARVRCTVPGCTTKKTGTYRRNQKSYTQSFQTRWYCKTCNVAVCGLPSGRKCWQYHTEPATHPNFGSVRTREASGRRHSGQFIRPRSTSFPKRRDSI
jgi:hypothetical protein